MENKMMVMRRALRDVSRVAEEMTRGTMMGESVDRKTVDAWAMRLCEIISQDLATPLRNCDVGASDEQAERFENFCLKHIGCAEETGGRHCVGCPLEKASRNITQKCELYWAQMPYEEGGEK